MEVIYRTFHNLRNDSQVAIHVLLLQLERFYNRHQCFPKIFYHQIDGGPENANQYMLAICELLVALGIVEKVVLTRLPVGHTHEDIDARYFSHTRALSLYLSPLLPTHSQAHTRAQIHTHTHAHTHTHGRIHYSLHSINEINQPNKQSSDEPFATSTHESKCGEAKSRCHRLTNLSLPAKSTSTGVLFLSVCCTVSPPLALGSRPPAMFRLRLWRRWFDSHRLAARDFVQIGNAADSRSAQPFDQLWLTKSADNIIVPRPKPAETKWKSVALLTNDDAKS